MRCAWLGRDAREVGAAPPNGNFLVPVAALEFGVTADALVAVRGPEVDRVLVGVGLTLGHGIGRVVRRALLERAVGALPPVGLQLGSGGDFAHVQRGHLVLGLSDVERGPSNRETAALLAVNAAVHCDVAGLVLSLHQHDEPLGWVLVAVEHRDVTALTAFAAGTGRAAGAGVATGAGRAAFAGRRAAGAGRAASVTTGAADVTAAACLASFVVVGSLGRICRARREDEGSRDGKVRIVAHGHLLLFVRNGTLFSRASMARRRYQ